MPISMRRRCLPFVFLLLAFPSIGQAETNCELTLPPMNASGESKMETYGWQHEIQSPRDTTPTTSSAERQHSPFVVVKAVDATSGGLMEALFSGEALRGRVLVDCTITKAGAEEHYFTIELVDATVSRIRTEMISGADSIGSLAGARQMVEEVTLDYEAFEYRAYGQGGHMTVVDDYGVKTATADALR